MMIRIIQKNLVSHHHLAIWHDDCLALLKRCIFTTQKNLALPGFVQECQQVLVSRSASRSWSAGLRAGLGQQECQQVLVSRSASRSWSAEVPAGVPTGLDQQGCQQGQSLCNQSRRIHQTSMKKTDKSTVGEMNKSFERKQYLTRLNSSETRSAHCTRFKMNASMLPSNMMKFTIDAVITSKL